MLQGKGEFLRVAEWDPQDWLKLGTVPSGIGPCPNLCSLPVVGREKAGGRERVNRPSSLQVPERTEDGWDLFTGPPHCPASRLSACLCPARDDCDPVTGQAQCWDPGILSLGIPKHLGPL